MLKKLVLGFVFCFQSSLIFCQFATNYEPISYKGVLPEEFLFNPSESVNKSIAEQNLLDQDGARDFYNSIYYEKKQLFLKGDIYFNDELTSYVRSVADKLLQNNAAIKNRIHIYVTRFPSPNAMALPDGTILINVGLLTILENEAQLAFIIAHEIAHIELKHSIKNLAKMNDILKEQINTNNTEGNIFRNLRYSRESEFESDAKAIEYLLMSDYNAVESSKIIKMFYDSTYLKFTNKIDYKKWFGSKIDDATVLFVQKEKGSSKSKDFVLGRDEYDDLFETHPDYGKRIEAIKAILQISNYNEKGKLLNTRPQQDIDKIKLTAQFELLNNYYLKSDFLNSIYLTLNLLNLNPENGFLLGKLVQNLYWLSFYKEIKSLPEVTNDEAGILNTDYRNLMAFISNIGLKEIKEVNYNLSKDLAEKNEKNDELGFYYILSAESYLGKETARFLYIKYKTQFPSGKYLSLVENKLN